MGSLAQAVIDAAHDMQARPDAFWSERVRQFYAATARLKLNDPSLIDPLARNIRAYHGALPELADDIKKAMRFSIDDNVADAMIKMHKTPASTLRGALRYARLPHAKTWVEYSVSGYGFKNGWMISGLENGISIKATVSSPNLGHVPVYTRSTGHYIINEHGFHFAEMGTPNRPIPEEDMQVLIKSKDTMCCMALSILLLLNSRSNILSANQPTENFSVLNKRRAERGHAPMLPVGKITFDVARVLGRNPELTGEEAGHQMAAALVRGHFKVRKTGVFFWSPYVRNASSDEEKSAVIEHSLTRDREATKTGPAALPGHPPSFDNL